MVRISEPSARNRRPSSRKLFARDHVGPWEDLAVAACALQSAQGFSEEVIGDWDVVEGLAELSWHQMVDVFVTPAHLI